MKKRTQDKHSAKREYKRNGGLRMGSLGTLLAVMIVFGGMILLEIRLSRKKNKWLGLIMPGIVFILASICVVGLIRYDILYKNSTNNEQSVNNLAEDNQEDSQDTYVKNEKKYVKSSGDYIILSIFYLLIANIPNYFLIAVYLSTRENMGYRKRTALEQRLYKKDLRGR